MEHSVDMMKEADYIIELGPGGGRSGGEIIFSGLPSEMPACKSSVTAPYVVESLPSGEEESRA